MEDVDGAWLSIEGQSGKSIDLIISKRVITPKYLGQLGHTVS